MLANSLKLSALLALLCASTVTLGETIALTPEGKKVVLYKDGTWQFKADQGPEPSEKLLLVLEKKKDLKTKCKVGLRLTNNLGTEVKTIVPVFSAYIENNVRFDSVSKDFFNIRPTQNTYREITFFGVGCEKIRYVKVHGADRCTIGERDKFSSQPGECLGMIHVAESKLMKIVKE